MHFILWRLLGLYSLLSRGHVPWNSLYEGNITSVGLKNESKREDPCFESWDLSFRRTRKEAWKCHQKIKSQAELLGYFNSILKFRRKWDENIKVALKIRNLNRKLWDCFQPKISNEKWREEIVGEIAIGTFLLVRIYRSWFGRKE